MNISGFFIDRPRFATVVSIVITIVGLLTYFSLPIAQYPEVVPPTIVVSANYPGANAETVARTVATPLEQEINGVEDMLYMSSQSTGDGRVTVTITFKLGTDLDDAQVLVQNRVAVAEPRLPEEVRRLGVTTNKSSPDLLMVVHMVSPDDSRDQLYISNYALLQIRDVIARLDGVGQVQFFGAREYSMRIWLDPERMAVLGVTAGDVVEALRAQNVQVAAGTLAQPPTEPGEAFQITINTQGRFDDPSQFEQVVVKTGADGRLLRVKDIASVELGAQDYQTNSYLDGDPAVAMVVFQRPGSNALGTAERVREAMARLGKDFPPGLEYRIVYDPTVFISESVNAVLHTIFEAVGLVVIVIVLFLQTWRAAIIPLVAIPVSLVGTFAVMGPLGFSLNNLSLFGLVLAIGIVVDDAIVVVENVQRNIELGLAPREAAHRAMDEVSSAVIAMSLVLVAVFVPTAFITGISGQFYRQFALTIATATVISLINSLTLSPALCAVFLRPTDAKQGRGARVWNVLTGWFFRGFNRAFQFSSNIYAAGVARIVRLSVLALVVYAGLLVATYFMFRVTPTGFVPEQDQGYLIVVIQLPEGASLERTDRVVEEASRIALETPGIDHAVAFAGFSGATRTNASNVAAIFTPFVPFEERRGRDLGAPSIRRDLQGRLGEITDASIFVVSPPPVRGIGTGGGFRMQVQDRSGRGLEMLEAVTNELVAKANQDPRLTSVFSTFRANSPQLYAEIDRTKAQMLDVPVQNIFEALSTFLGSAYVNDFNMLGRTYRVTAQAGAQYRIDPEDVSQLRARSTTGAMVPLGALLTMRPQTGPDRVMRYNLYSSASIDGSTPPGVSSGQALAAMEGLANETLPYGMDFEWTDLAYQQKLAGNTAIYVFPLAVLFVFLLLAAQYENWSLPLAIILIVPMCLLCAIVGVWLRGLDNNVLTQIGFIVLVALATKNAILIVEFAKVQEEEEGKSRLDAVVEAGRLRLRPILMTSFAFILGVVPLLLATGPAAEMRRAIGTAVFSGMLGVTLFGLFLTPVFYVVIRRLTASRRPVPGASAGDQVR